MIGFVVRARSDGIGHIEDALPSIGKLRSSCISHSVGIATDELPEVGEDRTPGSRRWLGLVADHCRALSLWGQQPDDVHLEAVQVLVLVDQHVAKAISQVRPEFLVAARARQ